jgi:phosphatidylglycerophosphatase A
MIARHIASVAGIGFLPKAPGTWGSLVALPAFYVLHGVGQFPLVLIATVAVFLLGWWATREVTAAQADHDPGWIVVVEVVGQWIALFSLSFGLWWMGFDSWGFPWPGYVLGFALFRLFDITKPWLVGWADRRGDPLGGMLDYVIAGVMAGLTVALLGALAHVVFV